MFLKKLLSLALLGGAVIVAALTSTVAVAVEEFRLSITSLENKELNMVLNGMALSEVIGNAPGTKGSPAPAVYKFTVPWSNESVKILSEAFANKPMDIQADYTATNASGDLYIFMTTKLKSCLISEVQITKTDITVGATGVSAAALAQNQGVVVTFTVLSPTVDTALAPGGQLRARSNFNGAGSAFLAVPGVPGDGNTHKDRGRRVSFNLVMKVPCRVLTAPVPEVKPTGKWDITSAEIWSDAGTSSPAYQEKLAKRTKIASATLTLWGLSPEGSDVLVTAINLNGLQFVAGERTLSAREATEKWWLNIQTAEFIGQTASDNAVIGGPSLQAAASRR